MTRRLTAIAGLALILAGCDRSRNQQPATANPGPRYAGAVSQPLANPAAQPGPAADSGGRTPVAGARRAPFGRPSVFGGRESGRAVTAAVKTAVVPAGTRIEVRLSQRLDTRRSRDGDRFHASLDAPVVVGDHVVLPKGTAFLGRVVMAKPSGRFKGRPVLGLTLESFQLHGATYRIATAENDRTSSGHKKRNAVFIGGGSGLGAAVGAVAGGTGALIGAGVGAAAGTAGAFITGRRDVKLPAETPLVFSLRSSVVVKS